MDLGRVWIDAPVGNGTVVIFHDFVFIVDAQLGESLIDEYFCKSNLLRY